MTTLAAGTLFGGYRIEEVAGRGGMGIVYRATQMALDRPVALKVVAPHLAEDHAFRDRFKREVYIAASLDHPNVVPVYEAGEHDGALYMVMRYVPGTDLAAVIEQEGRLEPERVCRILTQLAAALDAAHGRGLVHRDIKPHNILLAGDHVYLTDFGLTKAASSHTITRPGEVLGTLDYIAPELLREEPAGPRSDVYSLGCLVYHALAGTPPFKRSSDTARMLAHLNDPPPDLPDGPPALTAVIRCAMAKDQSERFASAGEFAQAATAALTGGTTVPVLPSSKPSRVRAAAAGAHAPPGGRRTRLALAIALPAVLFVGLVVAVLAAMGVLGEAEDAGGREGASATRGAPVPADRSSAGAAPAPAAAIPVGERPSGIAVSEDAVWVVAAGAGRLVRIDPATGRADEGVPAGRAPDAVAAGKGIVYVTSRADGRLRRFDARPDPVPTGTVRVGRAPEAVSLGKQLVWVASTGDGTVRRIDRASTDVVGDPIGVGAEPRGVVVGDGRVWVVNAGDGTVSRIDAATSEPIGDPVPVGDDPRAVVEAFGSAWVTLAGEDAVVRLDARTARPLGAPIPVGREPVGIAAGEGAVWVSNRASGTVTQIDPRSGRVAGRPIPVGAEPGAIAAGAGAVWVANTGDGTVTRIRPGRPLATE